MKIYAIIDRETNNVLGEFETAEEAEAMIREVAARDLGAHERVELIACNSESHQQPIRPETR